MTSRMINVTCGIILKDSRVLVTQRSEKMQLSLKWEFPGGKRMTFLTCLLGVQSSLKERLRISLLKILGRQLP